MKIPLPRFLHLAARKMSLRSPAFIATFGLFVIFFFQAKSTMTGNIQIKPQITQATKTDARCWTDDPQKHAARLGWNNDSRAHVKISYNKRTKTCLVEIELRVVRDRRIVMLSRSVGSTEGREYANFIWKAETADSSKAAIFCEVFLSSGEQLECHSESEFDEVLANLLR